MEHLEWLVQSRSANQQATVALFLLIKKHKRLISQRVALQDVAEELAAVAFSLWRAAFLSDLLKGDDERLTHLDLFLESLIADNTVVYATDKRSREWTFQYYMSNARFRLFDLAARFADDIVDAALLERRADHKKDEWTDTQKVLEDAITRFGLMLDERSKTSGNAASNNP